MENFTHTNMTALTGALKADETETRVFGKDPLACTNHYEMDEVSTVLMTIFLTISLVGIAGNLFSIRLLTSEQNAQNKIVSRVYTVYIIALAIADNGMLVFFGIIKHVVVALMYRPKEADFFYERYLCRWHRFLMHGFHNASGWILVVMTFDRFMAVCFPIIYRNIHKGSHFAQKLVILIYVVSFLIASIFINVGLVIKTEEETNTTISLCSLEATFTKNEAYVINVICHITISIIMPYLLLVIFSVFIMQALHCRRLNKARSESQVMTRLSRKITIMMLAVCTSYIFLWAPQLFLLLNHSDAHSHACEGDYIFRSLAMICALSNSALNFFLYCMTVKKFRDATKEMLMRCLAVCTSKGVVATVVQGAGEHNLLKQKNNNNSSSVATTTLAQQHLSKSGSRQLIASVR